MSAPENERKNAELHAATASVGAVDLAADHSGVSLDGEPALRRSRISPPIPVVVLGATLLIAIAAYVGYWMFVAAQLEARIGDWIEERQSEGFRINHGAISRSGFPGRVRLEIPHVDMAAPAGWSWLSPRVEIGTNPLAAHPLRVKTFGEQMVRLPSALGGAVLTARADRLSAELAANGRVPTGSAIGEKVTLNTEGTGDADSLQIGRMEIVVAATPATARASASDGHRYSLSASDLVLPANLPRPLGDRLGRLSLQTEVTGDLSTTTPSPSALARWRDEGGTMEISDLALDYGPLRLTGNGTLALDRTGEPVGAFALQARGLVDALKELADQGVIPPSVAAGAAFVFRPPQGKDGGNDVAVRVPVSLQDRKLYLGPLPIAHLPSPPWVPLPESGS